MSSMEGMFIKRQQQQPCMISTSTPSKPLAMHKNSHTISKVKPKIRIIHIFAPEIIKTDVANFRELVQRLTGKPSDHQKSSKNKKNPRIPRRENDQPRNSNPFDKQSIMISKKMEVRNNGFGGLGSRERVKEEEEMTMWNSANSGGFLGGFSDLDGFIQELGEFPLLPMEANHNMHGLEEAQLA